jgi:hypothetical protein
VGFLLRIHHGNHVHDGQIRHICSSGQFNLILRGNCMDGIIRHLKVQELTVRLFLYEHENRSTP